MRRIMCVVITLIGMSVSPAWGVEKLTLGEWYRFSRFEGMQWVTGAMAAFSLLSMRCPSQPTVDFVRHQMRGHYLASPSRRNDPAIAVMVAVLVEQHCLFMHEQALSDINSILKIPDADKKRHKE